MTMFARIEKLEQDGRDLVEAVRKLLTNHSLGAVEVNKALTARIDEIEQSTSERIGAMEKKLAELFDAVGSASTAAPPPSAPLSDLLSAPLAAELEKEPEPALDDGSPKPLWHNASSATGTLAPANAEISSAA